MNELPLDCLLLIRKLTAKGSFVLGYIPELETEIEDLYIKGKIIVLPDKEKKNPKEYRGWLFEDILTEGVLAKVLLASKK